MIRTVTVEPYSYDRYLGYTYRIVKGRRRRVHHWKTIHVSGYSYEIEIAAPRKKRKAKSTPPAEPRKKKPAAKPKPKPKAKKKKAKAKPKAAPAPKAKTPPPSPKGWMNAAEWQDFVDQHASREGMTISWDGDIYKKSAASDVISRDLFVWPSDRYPRGIRLAKYPDVGTKVFYMARLWVLIEHTEDEEMFVWVRTARLRREMDFDEAKAEIERLSNAVSADINDFPYLAFRGLIGWTLYTTGQHATRRRKKEGTA